MYHVELESAEGEFCSLCRRLGHDNPASHKVAEVLNDDTARHEFNVYLCCMHFSAVIPQAAKYCADWSVNMTIVAERELRTEVINGWEVNHVNL